MTRVYAIKREYVCDLIRQVCECSVNPNCENCRTYIQYKKSGQTIKEFGDENKI